MILPSPNDTVPIKEKKNFQKSPGLKFSSRRNLYIFFLKLSNTIRSLECICADILSKTGIMLSISIYIYIYYIRYIYVKYMNSLFLNTPGESACLWWVALKLYSFVSVNQIPLL